MILQKKRQEVLKSAIQNGAVSAADEQAIATLKQEVTVERESLSPVSNSDDEEEKENRKRKRIENLENARKVKKTKEPRTKGKLKTASARVLKESQVLCGAETQAVLNQLDDYLYTYHYGRPESGSRMVKTLRMTWSTASSSTSVMMMPLSCLVLLTICLPIMVLILSLNQSFKELHL